MLALILTAVTAWILTVPVQAAPQKQIVVYTPTPRADGRIIYIVKEGDTLISISIIMGISVEKIKELNNLKDDEIFANQELLLGLAGPAPETGATPGPTPTVTPLLPTPSPKPGSGNLCILLFNDVNGDSTRQETETSIPGGAISVRNTSGSVNLTQETTVGEEPFCFNEIAEGEYNIGVAVPSGYNPTTDSSYILALNAGDNTYIDFGAQVRDEITIEELPEEGVSGTKRSPLLGIIGLFFLLGGVGLAIMARKILKGK